MLVDKKWAGRKHRDRVLCPYTHVITVLLYETYTVYLVTNRKCLGVFERPIVVLLVCIVFHSGDIMNVVHYRKFWNNC